MLTLAEFLGFIDGIPLNYMIALQIKKIEGNNVLCFLILDTDFKPVKEIRSTLIDLEPGEKQNVK